MNRRRALFQLTTLLTSALPFAALSQSPARIVKLGILSSFSPATSGEWHAALRDSLRNLGWIEGRNLTIEYKYAQGRNERLPALAAELIKSTVDIIVADESTDAQAARTATGLTPIVMASGGAAVEIGLVESLARPGGNVTGQTLMSPELAGKHLELLREINPKLTSIAVLWNPLGRISELGWQAMQAAAKSAGVQLVSLPVRKAEELDGAFALALKSHAAALATMPNPVFASNLKRVAEFARKNKLPSIFHLREFAYAGGLASYGPNRTEMFRSAAVYVDKILKGAKPGDLPIAQPTKFDLILNLKTARALGIRIPDSVMIRADKVIE